MAHSIPVAQLTWLQSAWLFFCRLGVMLFYRLGMFWAKSAIHRVLWDRQWSSTQVSTYPTLAAQTAWMQGFVWKADGLIELGDAVCTPNKVQAVGRGNSPHGNDCDEEAIYNVASIQLSLDAGLMKSDGIANPRFFNVMWLEQGGSWVSGHNVCLLEKPQADGTVKYVYKDYYDISSGYSSVEEVANLVRQEYSGGDLSGNGDGTKDFAPICCAVLDINLHLVKFYWGA